MGGKWREREEKGEEVREGGKGKRSMEIHPSTVEIEGPGKC